MYQPPHQRGQPEADATRSLDDLVAESQYLQVGLQLAEGVEITESGPPLVACPFPWQERAAETKAITLEVPNQDRLAATDLLEWFKESCSNLPGARLVLPATLSKQGRAAFHTIADKLGLASHSEGIGESRFLNISHEQQPPDTNVPNDLRLKAKSIWDACQEEFGPVQSHSQAEIADMLAACTVSADIQQLLDRREQAAALTAKLKARDSEGALQMLDADPRLVHTRDPNTGLPPLHTAVKLASLPVVERLLSFPAAQQQRDSKRRSALDYAWQLPRQLPDGSSRAEVVAALQLAGVPSYSHEGSTRGRGRHRGTGGRGNSWRRGSGRAAAGGRPPDGEQQPTPAAVSHPVPESSHAASGPNAS